MIQIEVIRYFKEAIGFPLLESEREVVEVEKVQCQKS